MINRVTHQTVQRSTLANLQVNLSRMADLQGRMSGGKVITKPSDDPGGTGQAMQLRAERRAAEQHARNADDAVAWLTTVDSALQTSVASLRKARDLTVQGASSGTLNAISREAIAVELEGIRDGLLSQANTRYNGRSVFAGTSDRPQAFTEGSYAWQGTTDGTVQRRLGPESLVRADHDGSQAFGDGADSVFALIDSIVADLRAGVEVGPRLGEIDQRMTTMLGELAGVGTRHNAALTAQTSLQKVDADLKSQLSAIEDIDLAEVIVELQMQEVAYQGALGAAARVLQPSLMEFLR
ncbi:MULTISPECIES: flagellar hook-associated protein FlgL [unclassified Actinotalea]|uniref:flagellar hook-associated protein FlgL n=1 Tax=unclassified Actinotalea TaxID=2638618 RepID=UPI0015F43A55|nr:MULTISPECIES: flagellar hook-associated protein FlgL [unclassified Actinotalea]